MAIHDLSSEECHLRGRSGSRTKVLLPPGGIIEKKKEEALGKLVTLGEEETTLWDLTSNWKKNRDEVGGGEFSSGQWSIAWAGERVWEPSSSPLSLFPTTPFSSFT